VGGGAGFEPAWLLFQESHELVGDALLHDDAGQSHTPLARAAVGGVDDAVSSALEGGVLEDEGVVFGLGLGLDALAVLGGDAVNVLADAGGAGKADARSE